MGDVAWTTLTLLRNSHTRANPNNDRPSKVVPLITLSFCIMIYYPLLPWKLAEMYADGPLDQSFMVETSFYGSVKSSRSRTKATIAGFSGVSTRARASSRVRCPSRTRLASSST